MKRIIVTGASRGIGRALAMKLAANGDCVGVNYLRSKREAEELKDAYPLNIKLLPFDVSDAIAARAAISGFIEQHGTPDILINNAGIALPHLFVAQRSFSKTFSQFAVNFWGTLYCTQAVLPAMIRKGSGLIVNISSCAVPQPSSGLVTYAASKAAVETFSRGIAVEYADRNIHSVCLRLGPVDTSMLRDGVGVDAARKEMTEKTLLRKTITPEEVADAIVPLFDCATAMGTGSILDLTAGYR